MKTTAIIRSRGQLTIPDSIRAIAQWLRTSSAVSISLEKPDELVIKPHGKEEQVNWDKIWEGIHRSRSYKGKGKGSLSKFIAEDRYSH